MIANTLAITVAQRMRELATLRTLGASRRQVLGSVVLESVAIGLIGSVVGLFLGLGDRARADGAARSDRRPVAGQLARVLDPDGHRQPGRRNVDRVAGEPASAIRATRIEPIAAVREGATLPQVAVRPVRGRDVGRHLAAAVGLFSYGDARHNIDIKVRLLSLSPACCSLFVGVAMVAARVVRPLAFVVGSPGARFGGVAGRLARQNAVRNPSRTASTAAAVMIGLALITFVAVIGQGVRSSFSSSVDQLFVGDYAHQRRRRAPLTSKVALAAAKAPGVAAVSEVRSGRQDRHEEGHGHRRRPNMSKTIDIAWKDGSDEVPAQLGRNGAFVDDRYAKDHSLEVGSPIALKTQNGMRALHVIGIFDLPKGGSPFGVVTVSLATFDRSFANRVSTT